MSLQQAEVNQSTKNATGSGFEYKANNEAVKRDLTMNVVIACIHIVAFLCILIPKVVKPSLRIILMSLSMPGFLQNVVWAVVRVVMLGMTRPLVSSDAGCICLIYITYYGFICCQSTVSGLAINNCLAVYCPIRFKRWITPLKTFAFVTVMWLGWAVVVAGLSMYTDPGKPCMVLGVTPTPLLYVAASVILLTAFIVTVLNVLLLLKFRDSKIAPTTARTGQSLQSNVTHPHDRQSNELINSSVLRNASHSVQHGQWLPTTVQSTSVQTSTTAVESPSVSSTLDLLSIPKTNRSSASRKDFSIMAKTSARNSTATTDGQPQQLQSSTCSTGGSSVHLEENQIMKFNLTNASSRGPTHLFARRADSGLQRLEHVEDNHNLRGEDRLQSLLRDASNGSQQTSVCEASRSRTSTYTRSRQMSTTLIVLTIWNSVGYLPFMVCLLMAATNTGPGRMDGLASLANASALIARISTIGNTFVYAWRFIKWRALCSTFEFRFSRLRASCIIKCPCRIGSN